jgi:ParB-like chromosome segregation protein Spo0J
MTKSEMEFHEAANIFPLDEEHIDELTSDIRKNGQRVPIEIMGGKVLDGRRRWIACGKANVKPLTREVEVTDPVAYVLSLNLHRRHLSLTQLGMVAARAREWYDEEAKRRQKEGGQTAGKGRPKQVVENLPQANEVGKARDAVGKAVGVSGKTVDYATKVLKHGTPALVAAVDADRVAVSTAARAASLSEEEQNALAERVVQGSANGRRPRPTAAETESDPDNNPEDREVKGKGVYLAYEAINCLKRIPKNDALRKRGFQIVTDWIRHNP